MYVIRLMDTDIPNFGRSMSLTLYLKNFIGTIIQCALAEFDAIDLNSPYLMTKMFKISRDYL